MFGYKTLLGKVEALHNHIDARSENILYAINQIHEDVSRIDDIIIDIDVNKLSENIQKVNTMVNEFKGLIAISRAALPKRKVPKPLKPLSKKAPKSDIA